MIVIFGLSNPGEKYKTSRHNVGFQAIDLLAERWNISISAYKLHGLCGHGMIGDTKVLLVKPMTYMNDSGICVREVLDYYKVDEQDFFVIYDDIDLPVGRLRIRKAGSAGTHNGMRSIVMELGNQSFTRVRIGMGRPEEKHNLVNYVLSTPSCCEQEVLQRVLQIAADSSELIITGDLDKAMQLANRFDGMLSDSEE